MRYLGIGERTVLIEPMITKRIHTISAPDFETLIEKVRAIHELPNLQFKVTQSKDGYVLGIGPHPGNQTMNLATTYYPIRIVKYGQTTDIYAVDIPVWGDIRIIIPIDEI